MDTNRIKRFATEARTRLKEGIAAKIITLGFDKKGNVKDELKPQLMQGGTLWNGQLLPESFYHQWMSLYRRVQQKGINEAYEEAAYTWFNRLCAIRVLQKNNLCAPALDYADSARTPLIVDEARQGRIPQMTEEARARLMELLDDDTKVTEQFAALITAWCHDNPIINSCFGQMADYTELLLPNNILAENGFVDMLNHTDYITDADYRSPELIGWLYQFYISERKDEVFAKKGKLEADEIPAATQIFTPNWIVKYMVQNTVGRIYLDNNPYERQLQRRWQYLVEPPEKTASEDVLHYDELTDLRVADLACGSGHILNECFDLLYDLYIAEGYGRGEAIENIFRHNLTGIDIDLRAKQLAAFALLLKACQKDKSFVDGHCMPRVWAMPAVSRHAWRDLSGRFCRALGLRADSVINEELDAAFALMEDADSLGSIMKFDISPRTREFLLEAAGEQTKQRKLADSFKPLTEGFEVILALTEQYAALAMNPPYMVGGKMNDVLSRYVKENYPDGKADLFSTFMTLAIDRLAPCGKYGMINMQSWMFLSSFENLRKTLLDNYHIESMLHLGPRTFDELSGEVVQNTAFVVAKHAGQVGTYFRLVDGKDCGDKERIFLEALAEHTAKIYYPDVRQDSFEKIPGCPIGYWVSDKVKEIFTSNLALSAVASPCVGLQTADNARFLRLWHEVSRSRIGFGFENAASAARSGLKWFPYNKGGSFRKWYGNQEHIINWENDGKEIREYKGSVVRNPKTYFIQSVSWSKISSGNIAFRYYPQGFIYDVAGTSLFFFNEELIPYYIGLVNSNVMRSILKVISPTLNFEVGQISTLPVCEQSTPELIEYIQENISISRLDWDAHETSWDFRQNELVALAGQSDDDLTDTEAEATGDEPSLQKPCSISAKAVQHLCKSRAATLQKPCSVAAKAVQQRCKSRAAEGASTGGAGNVRLSDLAGKYHRKWEALFMQLHANEEELNRRFIDIYGLQDELSPEAPLSEVTILQAGEITIEEE